MPVPMSPLRLMALTCLLTLCLPLAAQAQVFVDQSRPGGNGSSWVQAFQTIEAAINASGDNAVIWVAHGIYTPSQTLSLKPGMHVYGGFAGHESDSDQRDIAANPTVVDGQGRLKHVFLINMLAANARLDGLTIRGGAATPGSGWDEYGGGLFIDMQNPTIANCVFEDNSASFSGGAVFVNRAAATFQNCVFRRNQSPKGGAMGVQDSPIFIENSQFESNLATEGSPQRGGAIWVNQGAPVISGSTFRDNRAGAFGGAVDFNNTSAQVHGGYFIGNEAQKAGGAIANNLGSLEVSGSRFVSNHARINEGGGVYSYFTPVALRDSVFQGNSASHGGGVMLDYKLDREDVIERCQFLGNSAFKEGGGLHSYARSVRVSSSIFAGNTAPNGGAIRVHGGDTPETSNPNYRTIFTNCTVYGNQAAQYGGGLLSSNTRDLRLQNCIFWANHAVIAIWDQNQGRHVPTPDYFLSGSSNLTVGYSNIQTLAWNHGALQENVSNSFSEDPRFINPYGPDGVLGTLDDIFELAPDSPCIDRADGALAPAVDILGNPRLDYPGVPNRGTGTPNYADIGAQETLPDAFRPNTLTERGWISAFYAAYWGRAGDPEGLSYWIDQAGSGLLTIPAVAEVFALSAEAKDMYPYFKAPHSATDADRLEFVLAVYRNLLNKSPGPEDQGVRYWVEELRTGRTTPGLLIGNVIYAAIQADGQDWATIWHKVRVSEYFTQRFATKGRIWRADDAHLARKALDGVTSEQATVASGRDRVRGLLP
ncbi:DUF4214 domain-containing protein [Desulfonatronum parangueonense]